MAKPTEIPGLGPGTPLSVAGPLLVRGRLDDVRRHEAAVAASGDGEPEMEAVHDMRTATRRLRAAIALFARGDLAELEVEVKALQDALGQVRDGQVQRRWFSEHTADGADGALAKWAGATLPRATKRLRQVLRAWSGAVAPSIARAAPDASRKGRLGGKRVARELRARLRRLERRLADARADPSPRDAHRLRIAAKKLRYVAELARPGFPVAAQEMVRVLAPLQERLGDLHDTDVRMERLERLARGDRRTRGAAPAVLALLREERTRAARALRRELARWRDERVVKRLRRALAGDPYRRARPTSSRLPKVARKSGASRATSQSSRSTGPRVRVSTSTTPSRTDARTPATG